MKGRGLILALAMIAGLLACADFGGKKEDAADGPSASTAPLLGRWGVDTASMSDRIAPGDDFYRHVNEGWLATAKPPVGIPYANAFIDAYLRTQAQLESLVTTLLAAPPAPGSDEARVAALYRSYTDLDRLDSLGPTPIRADLDALLAIGTREEVARWMGRPFTTSFFAIGVALDAANPERYLLHLEQSGLGLPSPEFHLLAGEPYAGHRLAYHAYVVELFERAGVDSARARADAILALEAAIARTHWTATERRDPVRSHHLLETRDLAREAKGFPWAVFLAESGFGDVREVVLTTDTAIRELAALFAATPVETLRSYLAFHYLDTFAPLLSSAWQASTFAFHGARLAGTPEREPSDQRALRFLGEQFGEPVGRLYVEKFFPPEHRAKMEKIVSRLRTAFAARLASNAWMDEATRREALEKLEAVVCQIGYPERFRDTSSLAFAADDLVGNVRKLAAYERADSIRALGEARRDWQWDYPAMEINAGYAPDRNSITFPAGILQPPFFDPFADPAVNYGAIGAVIGHELSHGFDDQGSQYDARGALRNWWTKASRDEFELRTRRLIEQFDHYSPIEGMTVNGALTLGENIGDLGGLAIAYDAYRLFVAEEQGGEAPVIDGYTGDQRFFLAWAQIWREYTTPDMLRQNLLGDPHSPGEFRTNGALRNMDPWYEAFDVKPGNALYLPPEARVRIW